MKPFPWQLGTFPEPSRRVIRGRGFEDPRTNFLQQREAERRRADAAKDAYESSRSNARAAWELAADLRVNTARSLSNRTNNFQGSAEVKAVRKNVLLKLLEDEWKAWTKEVVGKRGSCSKIEVLKAKAAALETAREEARLFIVEQALHKQRLSDNDYLRSFAAQARLEAVVESWEQDEFGRLAREKEVADKEAAFLGRWTPRIPVLGMDEPDAVARRMAARQASLQLAAALEENKVEQSLAKKEATSKDQAFLSKWIGLNHKGDVAYDNMYIWRNPAEALEESEMAAAAKISLDLDFDQICGEPESREQFARAFIEDLARQLGVEPHFVQITGFDRGSIVVSFKLLAGEGGRSPEALLAVLARAATAGQLFVAGAVATGFEVSLPPPTEQALAEALRAQERKEHLRLQAFNAHLAASRQAQMDAAAEEARRDARDAALREATALASERRLALSKAEQARREGLALEKLRREDIKTRLAAAAGQDSSPCGEEAFLWQRAEAEVERRRAASAVLAMAVERGRVEQLTARKVEAEEAKRERAAEKTQAEQACQQLHDVEEHAQRQKREQEMV